MRICAQSIMCVRLSLWDANPMKRPCRICRYSGNGRNKASSTSCPCIGHFCETCKAYREAYRPDHE